MHKVNDQLGLLRFIFPDVYLATSIEDLRRGIIPTERPSRWSLRNSISGIGYPGEVLIVLYGANLEFADQGRYRISDPTSELLLDEIESDYPLHPDSDHLSEITENPGRYDQVYLLHQPWSDLNSLHSLYGAIRNTPQHSRKSWKLDILGNPIFLPKLVFG